MPKNTLKAACFYLGVAVIAALWFKSLSTPRWERENPLTNPIAVTSVTDSKLSLSDGRSFDIAGITPAEGVSQSELDAFLLIATHQGVELVRDLGNGEAHFTAEPKFYNSCGTSSGRWAGTYCRSQLDEAAILCGYADPIEPENQTDEHAHWRRSAMLTLRQTRSANSQPDQIIPDRGIRYATQPRILEASDEDLEYFTDTTMPD